MTLWNFNYFLTSDIAILGDKTCSVNITVHLEEFLSDFVT